MPVSNANAQSLGVLREARMPWLGGNPRAASCPVLFILAFKVRGFTRISITVGDGWINVLKLRPIMRSCRGGLHRGRRAG